jgi:PAS domain S-box-containing protein
MENNSKLNLAGMAIVPELYTGRTIKIHPKYLFSLIGFGLGSMLSFISLVLEEYEIDFPAGPSHLPHLIVPLLFGITGTVIGFFFGKKRKNTEDAFHEIFANHQTMSMILDHLPVLISYLDTNLYFRYANKAYEKWMGPSMHDIYGKSVKDIVSEKFFELILLNLQKTDEGEDISFESSSYFKGEERFINAMLIPHLGSDKKIKGFFTIIVDITDLKERENEIRNQKDELAELNATKDMFFSIIAHDLKNPFTALLGISELLLKDYEIYNEETNKKFISIIYESANHIYKLLENLLAWSRSQSGKIEFNPSLVSIKAMVHENLKFFGHTAEMKNIQLQSDINDDYFINTDPDLIDTIIRNLLSNAIKFTPGDGKVIIDTKIVSGIQPNEYLEVSIKDTGLGISSENLITLFKIEVKNSSRGTNGESGTGLGLLICKEFVEKCGGKISVQSELGRGSTFKFTIPNK